MTYKILDIFKIILFSIFFQKKNKAYHIKRIKAISYDIIN